MNVPMNASNRFQLISNLFERARAMPRDRRVAFVREHCGIDQTMVQELLQLLDHHDEQDGLLAQPVAGEMAIEEISRLATSLDRELPPRIGRYLIQRKIGEGGMGVVYLAEQENPRRQVAVKVIRPGVVNHDTLKRFDLEVAVLGRLQHPGIARIYEAGTQDEGTDTQPYFAMEYVPGAPMLKYANDHSLNVSSRLQLFANVCDAVEHAHQRGVIHRDLKPSNVLIDDVGQPKILDFGVARATSSDLQISTMHTDVGQLIGTVAYMSPEQVLGHANQIDTRSDIFALGVMLYELVSGRLPYDLTDHTIVAAARVISEQEPSSLTTVNRQYRGDLDTIVQKAMEKEPDRRYQTAAALAGDIRHYLNDEPIVARPASTMYQLRKFAKRHKGLVAGVVATFVTLIAGIVVSTIFAIGQTRALKEAARQKVEAQAEAQFSQEVNKFLSNLISAVRPEQQGDEVTLREALVGATESIDNEPPDDARVETAIRIELGRAYEALADYDVAEAQWQTALQRAQQAYGGSHDRVATILHNLGVLDLRRGDYERAEKYFRQAITMARELGNFGELAAVFTDLATLCERGGRLSEAETSAREALAIYDHQALSVPTSARIITLQALSGALHSQARLDEAEKVALQALQLSQSEYGKRSHYAAACLNLLALIYDTSGRPEESVAMHRQVIELSSEVMGADHPQLAAAHYNLGMALRKMAKYEEAEAEFHRALEIWEPQLGRQNPLTLYALAAIGSVMLSTERADEAEPILHEVLDGRLRILGEEHPETAVSLVSLARLHSQRGEPQLAEPFYRRALAARQRSLGADHPRTLESLRHLAEHLHRTGNLAAAETAFRELSEKHAAKLGKDHPDSIAAQRQLAEIQLEQRRNEETALPKGNED